MTDFSLLTHLSSKANEILTYEKMRQSGLTKHQIREAEDLALIEWVSRGIYVHKDYLKDSLKIYQMENSNFIYSHETASYLHGLTDRYPSKYSVTTYSGYHLRNGSQFKIHYVKKEYLFLGIEEVLDNAGNNVKAYNKERTLCDFIRSKNKIESQIYTKSIQNYFKDKINFNRLSKYANALGIRQEMYEVTRLMKNN